MRDVLNPEYRPRIIKEDVHEVTFEQSPDLVTACFALQWINNPLQVFANAARQIKIGGYLAVHNIWGMHFRPREGEQWHSGSMFEEINYQHEGIPGFRILNLDSFSLILEKTKEVDFTYGLNLTEKYTVLQGYGHRYQTKPL